MRVYSTASAANPAAPLRYAAAWRGVVGLVQLGTESCR